MKSRHLYGLSNVISAADWIKTASWTLGSNVELDENQIKSDNMANSNKTIFGLHSTFSPWHDTGLNLGATPNAQPNAEKEFPFDPWTATEYEKKREWLKLEGFYETNTLHLENIIRSASDGLPFESTGVDSFPTPIDTSDRLTEIDFTLDLFTPPDQMDKDSHDLSQRRKDKDGYENRKMASLPSSPFGLPPYGTENGQKLERDFYRSTSNSNESWYNSSLPLVLPFLGKNPDNIEFQSSYYDDYEYFKGLPDHTSGSSSTPAAWDPNKVWGPTNLDPLKCMVNFFSFSDF